MKVYNLTQSPNPLDGAGPYEAAWRCLVKVALEAEVAVESRYPAYRLPEDDPLWLALADLRAVLEVS